MTTQPVGWVRSPGITKARQVKASRAFSFGLTMSEYDKQRGTSAERGYGSRWKTARATFLRSHPLCAMHMKLGRYVAANVVDHIVPHRGDQSLFWDKSNWQSLCAECHSRHKQRMEKTGIESGCDLAGIPVDRSHHWNRAG
jgi:hypothetical protein